jgi:signal transduction histidine kinase/FixJ family two-component response regulator
VLLVDDEEGIRTVLGINLADYGYQVITAENGRQALERFAESAPQIVITDIKMPVMDGVELLQRIKKDHPDTEVIVLTGHGDMELAISCLKLEATDFVTKPINDDAMEIALKRANEKITMRRQLRAYTENLERLVEEKSAQLVAAERRAAVGQALEGLIAAMHNIASDMDAGIQYFNDLPCFVSLHSPDLKIVAANQRFVSKLGDQTGEPSCRIYRDESDRRAVCPAKDTFRTGKGQRCSATVRLLDGTETSVIVHTAPIRNASGQVSLVVEIAADVAEIHRLQDELRTTQQHYKQLFNAAPCYITVQDKNLRITDANQRFREDFGSTANTRCYEIYQQRSQACPDCPVHRTFQDGHAHQAEMDVTASNGTRYRMLIWTAPLRDRTGKITHVMEMSTDVTRMRQLQDQLASLGLMIGSVSHGIKGLLTGLDSGMYLLDSGFSKQDLDRVQEGWQVVRLMIGRIRRLVQDILFYAKEKDLKWERVDVLEFARDVAELIQPEITRRGIALECVFEENLKQFEVDAGIVRATLSNVLENAMEACSSDTDRGKEHRIVFKVYPDNERICFEVGDNGIGMDEAMQAKIFTPFFISQKKSGTGLGLFIAGQILKKNNGEIRVQSAPGQGTRVFIKLPVTHSSARRNGCAAN